MPVSFKKKMPTPFELYGVGNRLICCSRSSSFFFSLIFTGLVARRIRRSVCGHDQSRSAENNPSYAAVHIVDFLIIKRPNFQN